MSKQKKGGRPRRVDYWHDPAAPKPTSRKPSASVIVRNSAGDLLLLRRSDSGRWTIPTGGLKKNETLTQCVRCANAARKPGWALRSLPWWECSVIRRT